MARYYPGIRAALSWDVVVYQTDTSPGSSWRTQPSASVWMVPGTWRDE